MDNFLKTLKPVSVFESELRKAIASQEEKLLIEARSIVPHLTAEDLLNPQDFPALQACPAIHYEQGLLTGLQMALVMLQTPSVCPPLSAIQSPNI